MITLLGLSIMKYLELNQQWARYYDLQPWFYATTKVTTELLILIPVSQRKTGQNWQFDEDNSNITWNEKHTH